MSSQTVTNQLRPKESPDFEKGGGVITAVAQDAVTGAVLMVAQMDQEAYERTLETGEMHYRSRTRGLWHKGATSGNIQRVESLRLDCDRDTVLARVISAGPACHTGDDTCFGPATTVSGTLNALAGIIHARAAAMPQVKEARSAANNATDRAEQTGSYTQRLLENRNLRLKKLGEETAELVLALADRDRDRAAEEAADLFYHTLVALRAEGITLSDVERVLAHRRAKPGQ
jgi:phosphoribosyl-ATP pyrophosphohydrolase/phosphoribosyl-AMP cyclohydrolase